MKRKGLRTRWNADVYPESLLCAQVFWVFSSSFPHNQTASAAAAVWLLLCVPRKKRREKRMKQVSRNE